ncbi:hypothetical protein OAU50_06475 [Planctomycetota bacterium]|nr:hypothetical protein [Planctomycetota bacterium]
MFTKARIPVDDAIREWTDERLDWLKENFGSDSLSRPVVEPTEEFFPFNWQPDAESLVNLLGTLSAYAGVDPERLGLTVVENTGAEPPPAIIKEGGKLILPVESSELRDINVVSSILIRKLMFIRLLDAGVDERESDLPLLSELTAVYLGLGIFCANTVTPKAPR